MVTKLIAIIGCMTAGVLLSVATMVYGYGVSVKSWPSLIVLGVIGQTFVATVLRKVLEEK